ncbi:hypothetical protein Tco_1434601 [Tanacetum coccineum]
MNNLEIQLNKENLHETNSKNAFRILKTPFKEFFHSKVLKTSNYEQDAREATEDFNQYTQLEAQSFKDILIQNMDSIKKCIVERTLHAQEIQKRLRRLNDKRLQIQDYKVQEVKALNASSGNIESSRKVSNKGNANSSGNDCSKTGNDQSLGNEGSTSGNEITRSGNECSEKINSGNYTDIRPSYDAELMAENDSNVTSDSSDMSHNVRKVDQHGANHKNEYVLLASSIE